jgi:hypothetical protein
MYLPLVSLHVLGSGGNVDVQVLDVLEAVAQIAEEGVVEMLEHATLANDVADALRPYDCYTTSAQVPGRPRVVTGCQSCPDGASKRTFIFSYVFERECEAGVLSLDNAHFSKGALADDSQQAEVVEVH